jgi:hypothetical protein
MLDYMTGDGSVLFKENVKKWFPGMSVDGVGSRIAPGEIQNDDVFIEEVKTLHPTPSTIDSRDSAPKTLNPNREDDLVGEGSRSLWLQGCGAPNSQGRGGEGLDGSLQVWSLRLGAGGRGLKVRGFGVWGPFRLELRI